MTNTTFINTKRRFLIQAMNLGAASVAISSLNACGFKLRGAPDFAFQTLFINAAPNTSTATELRRTLENSSSIRVFTEAKDMEHAQIVLDILSDQREKIVIAQTASGQVREFQLRIILRFKLRNLDGKELIEPSEIMRQQDISYSESAALAKQAEEALLFKSMQSDVVQQLMRRLASVRSVK